MSALQRGMLVAAVGLCLAAGGIGFGQGPGGGPPGGRGGPGGPMFMMRGGPGSGGMLEMPEVQQELKLSDEQRKKIEEILGKQREKSGEVFRNFNPFGAGDLDPEKRDEIFANMRKKMDEVSQETEKLVSELLDEGQRKRFGELTVQREGMALLLREEMANKLGLNEEQKRQLGDILAMPLPPFAPQNERDEQQKNALAVLNEGQKKQLEEMKGSPFKFPEMGGPGGPGGPMGQQERKLVAQFDKNGDERLNRAERDAAREFLKKNGGGNRGPFGFGGPPPGGPGGFGPPGGPPGGPGGPGGPGRGPGGPGGPSGFGRSEPSSPGIKISTSEVKPVSGDFYDTTMLRTLFLDFEDMDWEPEMAEFNNTDVDVPATLTVDGKSYKEVGVHFRGMSSFFTVPAGSKRSLNVSVDFAEKDQKVGGYKTLNLLNSHEDHTFLHTVLYLNIARKYIPAPRANFVRVVINGENWGIYTNAEQFNNDFIKANFPKSSGGTRWKVQGSPGGRGGLEYLGEDAERYKQIYTVKSGDKKKSWQALIHLCKVLNETPADQLEAALEPILDVEGALWFLALENVFINNDGYWVRASDYCLYLDDAGKMHIIPHDANETFGNAMMMMGFGGGRRGGFGGPGGPGGPGGRPGGRPSGPQGEKGAPEGGKKGPEGGKGPDFAKGGEGQKGPGGGRGPGGGFGMMGGPGGTGVKLDPLHGLNDMSKPLRSKLLASPGLKKRYLEKVKKLAEEELDWTKLGPVVQQYASLIDAEIKTDTKKLSSYEDFKKLTSQEMGEETAGPGGFGGPPVGLRKFAEERRKFLLEHPEIKGLVSQK